MHNEEILKQTLKEIDLLYKEQKFDAVCNLFLECVSSFENSDNNLSNTLKGEIYKKFAYFLCPLFAILFRQYINILIY